MESRAYTLGQYWRFLARPWKLATFAIAAAGLVLIAPYTGDPTWDYADAGFMSVLTFLTAPWSVGILYRWLRRMGPTWRQAMAALGVWWLSASGSYDLYLLWRDGYYPVTWWANLVASSVLYLCAGLLWSLEWQPGKGRAFAFVEPQWPPAEPAPFRRVALPALLLMLLVGVFIVSLLPR